MQKIVNLFFISIFLNCFNQSLGETCHELFRGKGIFSFNPIHKLENLNLDAALFKKRFEESVLNKNYLGLNPVVMDVQFAENFSIGNEVKKSVALVLVDAGSDYKLDIFDRETLKLLRTLDVQKEEMEAEKSFSNIPRNLIKEPQNGASGMVVEFSITNDPKSGDPILVARTARNVVIIQNLNHPEQKRVKKMPIIGEFTARSPVSITPFFTQAGALQVLLSSESSGLLLNDKLKVITKVKFSPRNILLAPHLPRGPLVHFRINGRDYFIGRDHHVNHFEGNSDYGAWSVFNLSSKQSSAYAYFSDGELIEAQKSKEVPLGAWMLEKNPAARRDTTSNLSTGTSESNTSHELEVFAVLESIQVVRNFAEDVVLINNPVPRIDNDLKNALEYSSNNAENKLAILAAKVFFNDLIHLRDPQVDPRITSSENEIHQTKLEELEVYLDDESEDFSVSQLLYELSDEDLKAWMEIYVAREMGVQKEIEGLYRRTESDSGLLTEEEFRNIRLRIQFLETETEKILARPLLE